MASKQYDDLSKDELIRLLQARDQRDATRFGLVWEANEIERDKALNKDFVALDLDPSLSCGNAPWRNLIIEGDNFDALRHLRMTFAGKVKCIYIDPPYNTGNKDFIYNDRFVDKEDLWRHSKWCEFMFQRLTLAKDLLRQDGVILVSIDDNEIAQLRLIMDRIFGANNFVANIIWQKVFTVKNSARHFSDMHDYIVVFANNTDSWKPNLLPRSAELNETYSNPDDDQRGPWTTNAIQARNFYGAGTYEIRSPAGKVFLPPRGTYWRVSKESYDKLVDDKRIWWGSKGQSIPRIKKFLAEAKQGVVPATLWFHKEAGQNAEAKTELRTIMGEANEGDLFFVTPKPVRLIDRILRLTTDADSLIVDFFAGSGTTAHAVHKLNKEDGGNRRVILVSSTEATADEPDKNLCRDVCATRVRRVVEGYGDTEGLGGDFAYLRCRRIEPGRLMEIDHSQVWTALQLIHGETLAPFEDVPILSTGDEEQRLIYLPPVSYTHLTLPTNREV